MVWSHESSVCFQVIQIDGSARGEHRLGGVLEGFPIGDSLVFLALQFDETRVVLHSFGLFGFFSSSHFGWELCFFLSSL